MQVDRKGLEFIKGWEAFRSEPYQDEAGVWTNGYGHIKGVTKDTAPVTIEQALRNLREDLAPVEAAVEKYVTIPLTQNEFNAVVSFAFNAASGPNIGRFINSTLLRKLNAGDKQAAAREFDRWVYVRDAKTGQMRVSNGLTRRRAAEREMFLADFSQKRASAGQGKR
jgi:lysozyme